jgi:hypothetical protein
LSRVADGYVYPEAANYVRERNGEDLCMSSDNVYFLCEDCAREDNVLSTFFPEYYPEIYNTIRNFEDREEYKRIFASTIPMKHSEV